MASFAILWLGCVVLYITGTQTFYRFKGESGDEITRRNKVMLGYIFWYPLAVMSLITGLLLFFGDFNILSYYDVLHIKDSTLLMMCIAMIFRASIHANAHQYLVEWSSAETAAVLMMAILGFSFASVGTKAPVSVNPASMASSIAFNNGASITKKTCLYSAPNGSSVINRKLSSGCSYLVSGDSVTFVSESNGFTQIKFNNKSYWVKSSDVRH